MSSLSVEECPRVETVTEPETVTLKIPPEVRLTISPEDFWTLCTYNDFPRLERSAQGELIAMSPSNSSTNWFEATVLSRLIVWAETNGTGRAFGLTGGFTFPNSAVRAPDACWIRKERSDALNKKQRSQFAPVVPDFVIEIYSPSDSRKANQAKMVEYLGQGVRLGWLIDARTPAYEVEIYRPGQATETLKKPETVSGEDVLPGFVLELGKIIADAY